MIAKRKYEFEEPARIYGSLEGIHITCDLDDVLGDYMQGFLDFYNQLHDTRYLRSDLESYSLAKHLGEEEKRICDLVDRFAETYEYANLRVISGARETLKQLQDRGAILSVLTSRYASTHYATEEWITQNYPEIFNDIAYTNGKHCKGEMAEKMKSDLHIDDAAHNIYSVTSKGINSILYSAPWNKNVIIPNTCDRANTFKEVMKIMNHIEEKNSKRNWEIKNEN